MARSRKAKAAPAPTGKLDFVARITHPKRLMRSVAMRADTEAEAIERVLDYMRDPDLAQWRLLDVVTVDEARKRAEGRRDA